VLDKGVCNIQPAFRRVELVLAQHNEVAQPVPQKSAAVCAYTGEAQMKLIQRALMLMTMTAAVHAQPLPSEAQQQERIRKYEHLVADNPRDIEFWADLADIYREAEMWDKAIHADSEAIQRFPKYAFAYYSRGKAKVGKEDYAAAVADFNEAIRLIELRGGLQIYLTEEQPPESYIDSYRSRGVALSHLNRFNEGIADLAIALKLRQDDPTLLFEKGYLEEKGGRKQDAVADLERAGLIYADGRDRSSAQECVTHLEGLSAKSEADEIRRKLEPKKAKSDLP
jgi:tetratricopeptide (TPR) repeat protein